MDLRVFYLFALFNLCRAEDELLDAYVRHVEERNVLDYEDYIPATLDRTKRQVNDLAQWTHSEELDRNGFVVLRWQPRHQEILFRVEARTKGYIGIGFSPDGGMENADIVIGWVDDGNGKAFLLVN